MSPVVNSKEHEPPITAEWRKHFYSEPNVTFFLRSSAMLETSLEKERKRKTASYLQMENAVKREKMATQIVSGHKFFLRDRYSPSYALSEPRPSCTQDY